MNTQNSNSDLIVEKIEKEIEDRTQNLSSTLQSTYKKLSELEIETAICVIKNKLRTTMYAILFAQVSDESPDTALQVESLESSLNLVLAIISETLIELNASRT